MGTYPIVAAEEVDIRAGYVTQIGERNWGIVIPIDGREYLIDFGIGGISLFRSLEEAHEQLRSAWGITARQDDPALLPAINWDEVPESVRLQERPFRGSVWGIVAILPDEERLVLFDQFANDAGYRTFYLDQESARNAIAFLEIGQTPPDPDPLVEERLKAVITLPPFVLGSFVKEIALSSSEFGEREHLEDVLVALDKVAEDDCQKVLALEQEWRWRLEQGSRRSCICAQCRHEIRHKLNQILDWYDQGPGYIPYNLEQAANRLLVLLDR